MRKSIVAAIVVMLAAGCGGDDVQTVRACSDLDVTSLGDNASIDALVLRYDGAPCVEPLAGGISGDLHECAFGSASGCNGESTGLGRFGCACRGTQLHCSNGVALAQHACGDAGVDAP